MCECASQSLRTPPPLPPDLALPLPPPIYVQLPTSDEVEYWKNPDKAGWLQSQSEHIKAWRKRWFVLKQGYLFRWGGGRVEGGGEDRYLFRWVWGQGGGGE